MTTTTKATENKLKKRKSLTDQNCNKYSSFFVLKPKQNDKKFTQPIFLSFDDKIFMIMTHFHKL